MRYWVGIDLGSTTTKAIIVDENAEVRGRGITNSRSDYDVACQVALGEAQTNTRFSLLESELTRATRSSEESAGFLEQLTLRFREQQYQSQLEALGEQVERYFEILSSPPVVQETSRECLEAMRSETDELFAPGSSRKSDFFRDLAGSRYLALAEERARERGVPFDALVALFDKAILDVENQPDAAGSFEGNMDRALQSLDSANAALRQAADRARDVDLEQVGSVGTGYGRARLPFAEAQIRSEILCHGLGAHSMFAGTRTVLDIGGQDTKAIQVDESGIVTSFQMNDRCAAGCGRYLGYIADEMNLGVHELGPLAAKAKRPVRINSTCTVFAGAELRERLSLGEKREDILAGLHRSIILRAMSLLARSGGIHDEFTFTGGVARNPEAVKALERLVRENYGERTLNISPDSIYTGAMGAALFALRDTQKRQRELARAEAGKGLS
ncbi:MAG: benzoyl-CoA reductase subunit A [Planctomycetes bacterium]|nr:benzoyl-CoA reductase subunit A [Planctomycetota bacterium]